MIGKKFMKLLQELLDQFIGIHDAQGEQRDLKNYLGIYHLFSEFH